jgi:hypothetical protein
VKASDLKKKQLRDRLKRFREGQVDRLSGKPASSTDGTYLDGWYAPYQTCPDFLTPGRLKELEK